MQSFSFDKFDLISDSRDGKNFGIINNLENAATRGSDLAIGMLERLKLLTSIPDYPKPHHGVEVNLNELNCIPTGDKEYHA